MVWDIWHVPVNWTPLIQVGDGFWHLYICMISDRSCILILDNVYANERNKFFFWNIRRVYLELFVGFGGASRVWMGKRDCRRIFEQHYRQTIGMGVRDKMKPLAYYSYVGLNWRLCEWFYRRKWDIRIDTHSSKPDRHFIERIFVCLSRSKQFLRLPRLTDSLLNKPLIPISHSFNSKMRCRRK